MEFGTLGTLFLIVSCAGSFLLARWIRKRRQDKRRAQERAASEAVQSRQVRRARERRQRR